MNKMIVMLILCISIIATSYGEKTKSRVKKIEKKITLFARDNENFWNALKYLHFEISKEEKKRIKTWRHASRLCSPRNMEASGN